MKSSTRISDEESSIGNLIAGLIVSAIAITCLATLIISAVTYGQSKDAVAATERNQSPIVEIETRVKVFLETNGLMGSATSQAVYGLLGNAIRVIDANNGTPGLAVVNSTDDRATTVVVFPHKVNTNTLVWYNNGDRPAMIPTCLVAAIIDSCSDKWMACVVQMTPDSC